MCIKSVPIKKKKGFVISGSVVYSLTANVMFVLS